MFGSHRPLYPNEQIPVDDPESPSPGANALKYSAGRRAGRTEVYEPHFQTRSRKWSTNPRRAGTLPIHQDHLGSSPRYSSNKPP